MDTDLHNYLVREIKQGGEAYIRNLAAAEAAVLRGQFNVAKVLRAMAHAQRVQALEAARLLDTYQDSGQLLETILQELEVEPELSIDTKEILQLQRQFAVRKSLQDILVRAINSLKSHTDIQENEVAQLMWGCYGCGSIWEGNRPEVCSVCGASGVEFEFFGPFYVSTCEQLGRLSPAEIVEILQTIPEQVNQAVSQVTEEVLARKPSPQEWSIKEIIGHMVETHHLFNEKVHFLLEAEGMPVLDFKVPPWKTHEGKGYESAPAGELLDELKVVCQSNLKLVESLEPKDWLRRGTVRTLVTNLLDYGTWLTNHDRGHLAQIKQLCIL
ncbi:MAG TPA: DinB family protein [Chloroflexia bacterium]|nr:DinB family protein [Chloroflexia bacterium]